MSFSSTSRHPRKEVHPWTPAHGHQSPIMATTSSMFMYSLTIKPPSSITQAILGSFSGTKEQQIVTASGSRLTLHRPDPQQGKVTPILSHDVFGIVRSLAAFRIAGSNKGTFPPDSRESTHSDSSKFRNRSLHPSRPAGNGAYSVDHLCCWNRAEALQTTSS